MRAVIEIQSSQHGSRRFVLHENTHLRVGREADVTVHDDEMMDVQFSLELEGSTLQLVAPVGERGTLLNGEWVTRAVLSSGDIIRAGTTQFAVRLASSAQTQLLLDSIAPTAALLPEAFLPPLLRELYIEKRPLCALLDAARDARILALLRASDEEYQSLYEGFQGQLLSEQAPYLVRLSCQSTLLRALLCHGWGNAWGMFLTTEEPFREVRRHLRRFLYIQDAAGKPLYFRYYDPRVFRRLLGVCTQMQAVDFFGRISAFIVEGQDPATLLRFTCVDQAISRAEKRLTSTTHTASRS